MPLELSECIPAHLRPGLKKPPYHMSVDFFAALLRQLREEGVQWIRFVHFEGRGDPLMNPGLGEMIATTRAHYPRALTMVTTHGSYPYRPWLVESGLDVLRLSVDGATPESYRRYRVGGDLECVLALMRRIRHERRSRDRPRMQWKYILFEWNDGDDELRLAGQLADDLESDLCFCLVHTPGRSRRFSSPEDLSQTLARLAPRASWDLTFPLKLHGAESVEPVVAEHAQALLRRAWGRYRARSDNEGLALVSAALGSELASMP